MTLFSILLFPLSSLWLISGKPETDRLKQLWNDFRDYYLHGIFYFIPAILIVNLLTGFLNRTYSLANIYLYHFFTDFFYFSRDFLQLLLFIHHFTITAMVIFILILSFLPPGC